MAPVMHCGQPYLMDYGVFRLTLWVSPRSEPGCNTKHELNSPAWQQMQVGQMVTCMKHERSHAGAHKLLLVAETQLTKAFSPPQTQQVGAKPDLSASSASQHPPRDVRCCQDELLCLPPRSPYHRHHHCHNECLLS